MSASSGTDLLDRVLDHLRAVGLAIVDIDKDSGVDALVQVRTPTGSTQTYEVQVKTRVSPATALAIRPARRGRTLVVTTHVSESVGEYWRDQDIHYVDSVGNMYMRLEGLAADIRGRKGPAAPRPGELGRPRRLFQESGLKILFALLSEPDMVKASYREIARACRMSLGTVHWVFNELAEMGYLDLQSRTLHRTGELLTRWADGYTLDLSPRLTLARFDAPDPTWWAGADDALRAEDAQWGGETAEHFLSGHLLPGRAIVYAAALPTRLAGAYRFRKAEGEGNVEVRQRFWSEAEQPRAMTVPTPLVYADLIASADPRQMEAAANLREQDDFLRRLDHS